MNYSTVYDIPVLTLSAADIMILLCIFGIVLLIASAVASAILEE